jgi:energy-coupling factor transporter ATP-binding protein EcfA2
VEPAVIGSGHGFQVWWLFREPWILESVEERERAAALLRRFQATMRAHAAIRGWVIDSTYDLARVLRPPGTINRKPGLLPIPVTLERIEPDRRYDPIDFEPYLIAEDNGSSENTAVPPGSKWTKEQIEARRAAISDTEILRIARNAANGDKFRSLFDRGDTSEHGGDDSDADAALVAMLAFYAGPDPERIDRLFRQSKLYREKWDENRGGTTYGYFTIGKWLSSGKAVFYDPGGKERLTMDGAAADSQRGTRKRSAASQLVDLVREAADLYHDPDGETYADLAESPIRATYPVRSRGLRLAAAKMFYAANGTAPRAQAMSEALTTLEAMALFDGPERRVHVRVAAEGETVYLDLADKDWRAVEITPGGWRVVYTPPVRFKRAPGMLPLPVPEPGGDADNLRPYLNLDDGDAWMLVFAWLTHALTAAGPYCILALHGEQGSGKSTTARALRRLIDPHQVELRSEPREERDLMVACGGSWIVGLDNLSAISREWSDALCRLSTGGGFGCRTLYADRDETLFSAKRPIFINGIEELAQAGDLLDRSIIITLPPIPESSRLEEAVYWQGYEAAWPKLLGAVLTATSRTLRTVPTVRPAALARMADFHRWGAALEVAMDWPTGSFTEAYIQNRGEAVGLTLDAQPVAAVLLVFAREVGTWSGTARKLLDELEPKASERDKKSQGWPKDAGALGRRLRRLAPALRAAGLDVTFLREGRRGSRKILLGLNGEHEVGEMPSDASGPSADQSCRGHMGGDADGADGTDSCRGPYTTTDEGREPGQEG